MKVQCLLPSDWGMVSDIAGIMSPKNTAIGFSIVSWVFAVSTFFGAAILFLLEPLVGKSLLPWYGGTPAVWNTCVVFFQLLLLLGYLYAHWLHRRLSIGRQLMVHAVVSTAALLTLPIRVQGTGWINPTLPPVISLLADLATSVGLVFFLVSTTAPLLQAWYAAARLPGNPYLLYVASNAGSLFGLLVYPTIVEFWYPLSAQRDLLTWAFVGLVVLFAICGVIARCGGRTALEINRGSAETAPPISTELRWKWFWWSLCPSSLMLGVTTFLSTEIAPMPAIWMLPLSLYLLTFIIAFARTPEWLGLVCATAYILLTIFVLVAGLFFPDQALIGLLLHCGLLFCGALAMHGRLSETRPGTRYLTEFYLWISCGGLCGSIFNTLLAPLVFNWMAEYPLAIALGLWRLPLPNFLRGRGGVPFRLATTTLVLVGMSWDVYFSAASRLVVLRHRTFFGEFHVARGRLGVMQQLVHGRTVHGMQVASQSRRERRPPLTYYFFTGPIGQLILGYRGTPVTRSVGVVGLGVGSLAGYAEQGEEYTFYEIDPAIAQVAEDSRYFTFLNDARDRGAQIGVVLGDARLKLRDAPSNAFGLLVLDAFTSDAIPVHLLTKEAIAEYFSKLHPDGIIACHISNQFVDLEPVLANIAADIGCVAYIQNDDRLLMEERRRGKNPSRWVVLAASEAALKNLLLKGPWVPCRTRPELGIWTDDQSNLLSVIRSTEPIKQK